MRKHIPNIITCCNLVSGCVAVVYALHMNAQMALLFIILGAVFDFFDGMSARLLGVSSEIGKELDSLADDVTFGVAPACMIYAELSVLDYPSFLNVAPALQILPYLAFIVAAFSAVRLAKFNLDTRQTTSFIGLPTPANALFWGALIVGFGPLLEQYTAYAALIILGIFLSSWLLVAEIPMFALKFKHWGIKGNELKYGFILFSALVLIAAIVAGFTTHRYHLCWSGFSVVIVAYVVISILLKYKK